jgi:hypothetical protein
MSSSSSRSSSSSSGTGEDPGHAGEGDPGHEQWGHGLGRGGERHHQRTEHEQADRDGQLALAGEDHGPIVAAPPLARPDVRRNPAAQASG